MKKGFTLMEMIVALGIFAVAAVISTSSILSLTDAQKKAAALQNTYDNLRFALELIAKDIRTGDTFYCGTAPDDIVLPPTSQPCVSGGPVLTYQNSDGDAVSYRALNGRVEKLVNGVLAGALTAANVTIQRLTFYVFSGAGTQPRIMMVISGEAGSGRSASAFNLQTSVSQRKIGI